MSELVVVMGVSGCGKSTVGAAIAHRQHLPFADADDFHPPTSIEKMAAGLPLDDDDRYPWLEAIGQWLADHSRGGGVMVCSALKRRYRDQLRRHAPGIMFVHLHGDYEVIERRQGKRLGHFMPASLLASQFSTLEPLDSDEYCLVIDVDQGVDAIVQSYVDASIAPSDRSSGPQTTSERTDGSTSSDLR